MCRSIKTLYHTDPPPTEADIYAASLQYVRKISGYRQPSKANEAVFEQAVQEIATATQKLMSSLETSGPVRPRK
ncbi:MAG: DUF2277 domain-containing protein [Anaerolineae bacterium]|nr:DUF2277 domain-containing protein [Anaerolineae bacterium]